MQTSPYQLLDKINSPADLRLLREEDLVQVSNELRQFIIDEVSSNPGHFGASLGVVELTVALHYVFDTPNDLLVWDVGHQAYGHKILTGRRDVFHTNRKYKGISGFPKMSESVYDSFGVGHSSTSISAALGMATAAKHKGETDKRVIAIIGDGSMTGGLVFEALNNAGIEKTNLLVILNDNQISIDPSTGALNEYLLDITTSRTYNKVRNEVWDWLGKLSKFGPNSQALIQKIENGIKSIVLKQSNLFESLNFRYFGPIDGHDVVYMTKILRDLKQIQGPILLHCITKKGKGFKQAEIHQTIYHAPGPFNKETGELLSKSQSPLPPRYQDVFGHTLVELAIQNPKIVGITPAMPSGCSMNFLKDTLPDRFYDVGIAEQHAVTFAAGLASQGMVPFCNIYSTFIQRAYDQVIHDVALQNLHVVFCLDRAGLVGDDGATHHGFFDLVFMRNIPNMTVAAPLNEEDLRNMMFTFQQPQCGPCVIRYPRGSGMTLDWKKPFKEIPIGKAQLLSEGNDIAILTIGTVGNFIPEVIQRLGIEDYTVTHYDMRFVNPIDETVLHKVFKKFDTIITVEDGFVKGGFGTAVLEFMCENTYNATVKRLGIPDRFVEHGTQPELYKECGYDVDGIYFAAKQLLADRKPKTITAYQSTAINY